MAMRMYARHMSTHESGSNPTIPEVVKKHFVVSFRIYLFDVNDPKACRHGILAYAIIVEQLHVLM